MEKISIIMPCYNAAAHLYKSINSVLQQTFKDIELIVVNNGSTDQSLQILQSIRDPRLRIINESNKGVCSARNRGLAEAKNNYIAFLDADDTWRLDCMEKLYSALQNDRKAVLAYCGWQNVGLPGGKGMPYVPPDYESEGKYEYLLRDCPWPIHAALTIRNAIKTAGGFDEYLTNAEDYKLWLQIAWFHKIIRVPEAMAFYHFHSGPQATKNRAKAAKEHWSVQREFLQKHPDISKKLGFRRIRELTHGELLKRGYVCYWERDMDSARQIFRIVMKQGYGMLKDWKYMIPALFPLSLHSTLIRLVEKNKRAAA